MDTSNYVITIISENKDIYKLIEGFSKNLIDEEVKLYHRSILNYEFCSDDIVPDIILIDENTEEKTLDTIKKFKNNYCDKSIKIIVGLQEDNEKLNRFIEAGAEDYIIKPYEKNKIFIRLRKSLELIKEKRDSKSRTILFNSVLNNGPYMSWFKDKDSNYIIVNDEFQSHSGKTIDMIKGNGDKYVWDGKIGNKCKEYDLEVMRTRKRKIFDEVIPGKQGYKQFNIYKAPVIDENNEVIGTIGVARDITELKNKDAKMNIILESIPLAVWVKDTKGKITNVNREYSEFVNLKEEDIVGKDESEFLEDYNIRTIHDTDREVIKNKCRLIYEIYIKKDGVQRILEVHKSAILDISNEVIGVVGIFRDITEIKKIAYTDMLTELSNRRALYDYTHEKIKSFKKNIAFIRIDLDDFKNINDSCGHNYGDEVLVAMGKKLKKIFKDEFLARIGGDEFVLVIKDENEEMILNKAQKIVEELNMEFIYKDSSNFISASLGVAIDSNPNTTVDKLLLKADMALYKAKENGKNQYSIYSKELEQEKFLELQIENDLGKALNNKEIELYYQGQYTPEGKLKGFEALFRWNNEKYNKISVLKIIEILEKSNLIKPIGDYIIDSACKFCNDINEKYKNELTVSINISAVQIMKNKFVENIKNIILENKINPKLICIEITETVLIKNIEENIKKLKELTEFGVNISLDDFGIGYSSLNYLATLPLSEVKIDRSFVVGMRSREQYRSLIKLIIEAAHCLKLPVVAEGVEDEEELVILQDLKVDCIQGYLFSKPLPSEKVEELLKNLEK